MLIDTDVVIRFLTNDDVAKANQFRKFLESGRKGELVDVTVAEVYWTLKSLYQYPKLKILESLELLIDLRQIKCNRKILFNVIDVLRIKNVSFVDAYTAVCAKMKYKGKVMSFDKDYDKIKGVKRVEP